MFVRDRTGRNRRVERAGDCNNIIRLEGEYLQDDLLLSVPIFISILVVIIFIYAVN